LGNQKCPAVPQTCEDRARCNNGYIQFIVAIARQVTALPFTPEQLFCLVEQQLGSTNIDWQSIASSFVSKLSSSCLGGMGVLADAAQNLIQQVQQKFPLPVDGWKAIGSVVGQVCKAVQDNEDALDTLLKALPNNAGILNLCRIQWRTS